MQREHEKRGDTPITWNDCIIAADELIETIKSKLHEEPEHGTFWQEQFAIALCKRQEIVILKAQEEELILKAIGGIHERIRKEVER